MRSGFVMVWLSFILFIMAGCGDGSGMGSGMGSGSDSGGPLIASYSFDETSGSTATNSAGSKFHGLIYGASRVVGKSGNALQFGAPNARVNITPFNGDGKTMTFLNDTISIAAWIKADSITPGTYSHIIGNSSGGSETFKLQLNGDKLQFLLNDGASYSSIITSNQQLTANTWYHIALAYDGTIANIYINGVLDNSVTISFHVLPVYNLLYVGAEYSWSSCTNQFHGIIDELKLYNEMLSPTTIKQYYDATK